MTDIMYIYVYSLSHSSEHYSDTYLVLESGRLKFSGIWRS